MHKLVLAILLPLFLFAKPFKIATYNVENLFDTSVHGSEYEEYTPKHNWTSRMVEIKLNHTAEVICDMDADIIALEEVENESILKQLQQRLKTVGCNYPYYAITHKKEAPVQVALLSRFLVTDTTQLQVSSSPYVRDILEVDVQIAQNKIKLFVNHWKAKSRNGWESKRIKYAKRLKSRLDTLPQHLDYIVLGDFNTDYDACYALEAKINDTGGKTGVHDVLGVGSRFKLTQESEVSLGARGVHYTLWQELPSNQRWDTKFYGKRGTPDHILLPASLFDGKGVDYINDSFGVFRRDYLFTKRGYINSWEYKKGKHKGQGYSDHLPIFALFDVSPYQQKNVATVSKRETQKIEYLYERESLNSEVALKDAIVVWKRHNHALIKQSKNGRGIFLFNCANRLEEGKKYDLLITGISTYRGLKEVTHAYILKEKGKTKSDTFALRQSDFTDVTLLRQNELVKEIEGVYKNRQLHISGQRVPIYFKKGITPPVNGSRLKIGYGLLGYYKKLQLVVYSSDDFQMME